jgi:hypothetical protein
MLIKFHAHNIFNLMLSLSSQPKMRAKIIYRQINHLFVDLMMMRFDSRKCILIILILFNSLIGASFSLSYDFINPGAWNLVSNPDEIYNMPGWTTYSVKMDKMAELKILEGGKFSFAWKTDQLDPKNKLFFKHSYIQDQLECTTNWKRTNDYGVNKDDKLSWYLPNAVGQIWIAFPPQTGIEVISCTSGTKEVTGTEEVTRTKEVTGTEEVIGAKEKIGIMDQQIYVSGNNLQEEIDTHGNNTDIILTNEKYYINKTIIIRNKRNIRLTSNNGQSQLDGNGIDKLLSIQSSNNIYIEGLKMINSSNCVELINCSYVNINNSEIELVSPSDGILILYGNNNMINRTDIYNSSDSPNSPIVCVGINLTSTWNNQLIKNDIFSGNPTKKICHYVVRNSLNKGNKIFFKKQSNDLIVVQDQCNGVWNTETSDFEGVVDHEQNQECIIHDLCEDPTEWDP